MQHDLSQLTSIYNYLQQCDITTLTEYDAVVAALHTTLHYVLLPTALRCPTCSTWYVDKGWYAYNLHTWHTYYHCQHSFSVKLLMVGNLLAPCQSTWFTQTFSLNCQVIPTQLHVCAAFEGMDHLTIKSGIQDAATAQDYLKYLGIISPYHEVNILWGAQTIAVMPKLAANTTNPTLSTIDYLPYLRMLFRFHYCIMTSLSDL